MKKWKVHFCIPNQSKAKFMEAAITEEHKIYQKKAVTGTSEGTAFAAEWDKEFNGTRKLNGTDIIEGSLIENHL